MRPGAHKRIRGLEQLDKIISVDQSPIGRTPRSNPATYIGLFDQIRDLFSKTPEARARGYKPGRFSFNVKGGRCEVCRGDGQIKIEMHFLPDVYVPCEQCNGKRYNKETLDIRFKGKTIADVLEMPIEEAVEFFVHIPKIRRRLQTLHDVGLDYMRLGQPATTLSGGEAQRVKLAAELSKVATGRTLYILDEPTTGLHFADIQRLLEVLQRLVDAGNSVVVIEHNLDVIKTADALIDMGPEGGEEGGRLMAAGTPEEVAAVEESHTGEFLRTLVEPAKAKPRRRTGGGGGTRRRKVPAAA
jgi:excinuclease ABC subunit A